MKQDYLVIDVKLCMDCNNCFLACKDEYVGNDWPPFSVAQPLHGQRWMNILRKERGQYPTVDVAYRPSPCMHCQEPACLKAATGGAIYRREDGIVIVDPVKAKGQRAVVEACPYGSMYWNEEQDLPQKCTLCAHLLADGWKEPRCVQACSTGALRFLSVEPAEMQKIAAAEGLETLHPELGTRPRVYYKNLYRFDRCFIAGSVAIRAGGVDDCVKGATVTLHKDGQRLAEASTDAFGDFKFDGLDENSGAYVLEVAHPHYETSTLKAEVRLSVNAGTVWLKTAGG